MKLTALLGANQVLSHGFGVFLFAALFPFMRDDLGLTYWHLSAVGIATQLAYLAGAMSIGLLGRILPAEKLILLSAAASSGLLFSLAVLLQPVLMIMVLALLAFSAAVCWGSIVGIITRYVPADRAASSLSAAGSGTAWGYGVNGLLLLFWVPLLGWQITWMVTAAAGVFVLLLSLFMLRSLQGLPDVALVSPQVERSPGVLSTRKLFRALLTEQRAALSCAIYFLIGFTCITFSGWLNTYLDELGQTSLAGPTWTILGVSGMLAGAGIGRLADKKGHATAMLVMALGYAVSLAVFSYDPVEYAFIAGIGYGLIYFPVWGILASWVSQVYSPVATMQLSGLGMVASALGGSSGNFVAGLIQTTTGSLEMLYLLLASGSGVLLALALIMLWQQKQRSEQYEPCL